MNAKTDKIISKIAAVFYILIALAILGCALQIDKFPPSAWILAVVVVGCFIYFEMLPKLMGQRLRNAQWRATHGVESNLLLNFPAMVLGAPANEELILRAPLLISFSELSTTAWIWIFALGVVFALSHWPGAKFINLDLILKRENISSLIPGTKARKIAQTIFSFPVGIALGYCAVKYQSIWLCVGLHAALNLVMFLLRLFGESFMQYLITSREEDRRRPSWAWTREPSYMDNLVPSASAREAAGETASERVSAILGLGNPLISPKPANPNAVYVISGSGKGRRFHKHSCQHVWDKSTTELSFMEAIKQGFIPCRVCNPRKV